jgi:hypothetical protein
MNVRDRMEYDGYGADKRSGYERDHFGALTDAEVNGIQAEVEQRASDECDECSERFRDWLNSKNGRRTRQDYAEWRAAMLSEDEQREIIEGL